MLQTRWSCLLLAVVLSACGPAGKITGRVTVEGGSAAGVAVFVYGPVSGATVTTADGAFTVSSLPDGEYVVRATVRDADVEEVSVTTTIAQSGTAAPEPVLNFKASSATVTGRVVFADGTEASNLTVIATGPETVGTRTAVDGTFSFAKIKNGAYVVSVEVRDTREGRVGIGVDASGTKDVGELRLTPVGQLKGTVQYSGMPAAGITVSVPGTSVSSVTDDMGVFALANVPTGTFSVLARTGTAPFYRSASSVVMVSRGVNADVALTLTDDAPKTGTIQGLITFRGPRSPRDIQLTVPGTTVTGSPAANGAFALVVPVGVWEVIATAPSHPQLNLGRVEVREGGVSVLPGAMLSLYRTIWRSNATISLGGGGLPGPLINHPWSFITVNETSGGTSRLAIVHALTGELRFLAIGDFSGPQFSKNGKYVGWHVGNTVFVYEIATGAHTPLATTNDVSSFAFSSDESTIFVVRQVMTGSTLTRVPLANLAASVTFPSTGVSSDIRSQSSDRWFVREGAAGPIAEFHLVTPTSDLAQAFTDVTALSLTPTAWAYVACTLNCQVKVLSPTATTAAVLISGVTVASGGLSSFNTSSGEYPCYKITATGVSFCARSSDGSRHALPNDVSRLFYNTAGTRMIYTYRNGGALWAVREEAVPPVTTTTDLDVSAANNWSIGWLSPTRAYALETGAVAGRKVRIVTAGTAAPVDTDVGTQAFYLAPPLLVFPQQTTGKWRAILGDGPTRPIDMAVTTAPQNYTARSFEGDTMTRYGAVSFDGIGMHIIDEAAGMVRIRNDAFCSLMAVRSGSVEFCVGARAGGSSPIMYLFQNNTMLEYIDGSLTPQTFVGSVLNTVGLVGVSLDQREVMLGSITP